MMILRESVRQGIEILIFEILPIRMKCEVAKCGER